MLREIKEKFWSVFQRQSGAGSFLASVIVWGIAAGCLGAALNNFLVDVHNLNQFQRGLLELFRELPGFLLVFLLAFLSRVGDWQILRLGMFASMIGVIALCMPANIFVVMMMIMVWSTGEHLTMPVRSAIAMQIAHNNRAGASLGYVTSAMNAGLVLGSLLVSMIFILGRHVFMMPSRTGLYNWVWVTVFILVAASLMLSFTRGAPRVVSRRPKLFFAKKFNLFYLLELSYGARKQIFLTFGPFVLIKVYGIDTSHMALLMGISATINMFAGPMIGALTDRIGYRTIMVYDTVILFFVCMLYGYAGDWFSPKTAYWVIHVNFLFDALLSTTSMATNLYVRDLSRNREEITASLSTGISMNHLVSIIVAPLGGWVWLKWGIGALFSIAAMLAILNTIFAAHIPLRRARA